MYEISDLTIRFSTQILVTSFYYHNAGNLNFDDDNRFENQSWWLKGSHEETFKYMYCIYIIFDNAIFVSFYSDLGLHIDGFIAAVAYTVVVGATKVSFIEIL